MEPGGCAWLLLRCWARLQGGFEAGPGRAETVHIRQSRHALSCAHVDYPILYMPIWRCREETVSPTHAGVLVGTKYGRSIEWNGRAKTAISLCGRHYSSNEQSAYLVECRAAAAVIDGRSAEGVCIVWNGQMAGVPRVVGVIRSRRRGDTTDVMERWATHPPWTCNCQWTKTPAKDKHRCPPKNPSLGARSLCYIALAPIASCLSSSSFGEGRAMPFFPPRPPPATDGKGTFACLIHPYEPDSQTPPGLRCRFE